MPVLQPVWSEGTLTFTFSGDAAKYDAWAHYRNQFISTCKGAKAVDLVFLEKSSTETCWLIEVKDYRVHPRTKPVDLAEEVALKVRDTLTGLLSAQWHANDNDERRYASQAVRSKRVRVVLHLEQPARRNRLHPHAIELDKVLLKLKMLIKAIDPHPLVMDSSARSHVPWRVAAQAASP